MGRVRYPDLQSVFLGLTKLFFDLLAQFALRGKVAMPLGTSGSAAHVLALDYGLRPAVCTENPIRVDDVTESPKRVE
jgi:FMN reductase